LSLKSQRTLDVEEVKVEFSEENQREVPEDPPKWFMKYKIIGFVATNWGKIMMLVRAVMEFLDLYKDTFYVVHTQHQKKWLMHFLWISALFCPLFHFFNIIIMTKKVYSIHFAGKKEICHVCHMSWWKFILLKMKRFILEIFLL